MCDYDDQLVATIMDSVKYELGVHMNYTVAGDHDNVDKRNNCMVKDHTRSIKRYLQFRMISKSMVRKISTISTKHVNWLLVKAIVSPYYISHVIVYVSPLDYKNHCQILFGAYV